MRAMVGLLVALPLASGCGANQATQAVKHATIAELESETDHLVFFSYIGSDAEFHYFKTFEGNRYKVLRSELKDLEPSWSFTDGLELFVTIKDGKLTVPDPKTMAGLSEDELHRPFKKKRK